MKIKQIEIKPWDREQYPHLYTKTELKAMKLMPSPNAKHRAVVVRPRRYGGDYLLYDIEKTVPYRKTLKQKAEESRKRKAAREIRRKRELLQKQREGTAAVVSEMAPEKRYRLAVLDLETTGLDATEEEILQVAIIDQDGNELINEHCCPVLNNYWPEAQAVHGISPADVAGKMAFGEIAPKVAEILLSSELVLAYNESFEYSFLVENGLQPDRLYWADDPMDIFAYKYNEGRWVSLEHAAQHFGYHFAAHDALEDARATLHVYQKLNVEGKE